MAPTLGVKAVYPSWALYEKGQRLENDALRARHNRTHVRLARLAPAVPSDATACAHGEHAARRMARPRGTPLVYLRPPPTRPRDTFSHKLSRVLSRQIGPHLDLVPRPRAARRDTGDHKPHNTRVLCSRHGHKL